VITDSEEAFDVNVTLSVPIDEDGNPDFHNVDKYIKTDGGGEPYIENNSVAWYVYYNGNSRLYDDDLIDLGILEDSGDTYTWIDGSGVEHTSRIGVGTNHPREEFDDYGSGYFMIDFNDETGVANGTVKIIPGYTIRFTNMAAGTTCSAAETAESAAGYEVSYAYNHQAYVDGEPSGEPVPDTGDTHVVVVNQGNNVTITNKQTKSDLIVIKTDDNGTPITSESDTAQFSLVRNTANDGSGTWVNAVDSGNDPQLINNGVITINSTNGVELKGLADGLYQLTERKAPDGYIILTGSVTFKLVGGNVTFVTITETVDPDDSSKKNYTVTDIEAPAGYTITAKSDDRPAQLAIANTPGQSLPNTGGSGTLPYTLGGIALIMASALMYGFRVRRRERRSNNSL
jgi:LPXTG-motif cell wall-anchored protein